MAYRRLGRTGLMISEVVCGGDPITLENYKHLELALEMGLNYLDMAPAYNKGDTERAYGKLLAASPGRRDKVFLATKVSDFNSVRTRMYREVFDGLPESKQAAIRDRARDDRGVAPGRGARLLPDLLPRPAGPSSRPTSARPCSPSTAPRSRAAARCARRSPSRSRAA